MQITHVSAETRNNALEFLQYKQLTYFLVWRTLKVRYKQTMLGVLWTVLQPLLFAAIIGLILFRRGGFSFGYEGVSTMVVVVLSFGLWQFFEGSYNNSMISFVQNKALMTKIYFPRILLIISAIITKFVDFFLTLFVFIVLLFITGSHFNWIGFLYLFPALSLLSLTSFSIGLILGPLNLKYRDIQLTMPLINRLLFFSTPIWYPFDILPENLQTILLFNPITGMVELLRNAFFTGQVDNTFFLYPLVTLAVLFPIGILTFRKQESRLADYV